MRVLLGGAVLGGAVPEGAVVADGHPGAASRGAAAAQLDEPGHPVAVPGVVGWTLARRKTDDAGMLELLAPYAGHRYRVTRLIELGGSGPPRRGPRMSVRDYRSI